MKCRVCGEGKPLTAFNFMEDSGKYRTECKECQALRNKKYYKKIKEVGMPLLQAKKQTIPSNHHKCYECGSVMPIEKFKKDNRSRDGYSNLCLECKRKERDSLTEEQRKNINKQAREYIARPEVKKKRAEYAKKRYELKKDEILEYGRQWRRTPNGKDAVAIQNQNRRSHQKLPYGSLKELLAKENGKCYYCGRDATDNLHYDHYIPLSKGGENKPSNIRISCSKCNLRKGAKMPEIFYLEMYGASA